MTKSSLVLSAAGSRKVMESAGAKQKPRGGSERLLLAEDYFSLMLYGLFNPVVDSMRGLCAASHLADKLDLVDGTLLAALDQRTKPRRQAPFEILRAELGRLRRAHGNHR